MVYQKSKADSSSSAGSFTFKRIRQASSVSTDGERIWYPYTRLFLKLKHHLHSTFEKSIIIERTIKYIKKIESIFDDYFPSRSKTKCKLKHVQQWLSSFTGYYNKKIIA